MDVRNYDNFSTSIDPSVGMCRTSSSRLKMLGHVIEIKSAIEFYSHTLMIITTKFREDK